MSTSTNSGDVDAAAAAGPEADPDVEPDVDPDAALLERSAAGDRRAFGELYDRHARTVIRFALSRLGSMADAEDAAQEVFVLAWTKAAGIRLVGCSILPWLLVTARNVCANRLRALARDSAGEPAEQASVATPETAALAAQLRQAIDDAVAELSDVDRMLYLMCLDEGISYTAAAAELGLSHGAVRGRLARLRRALRSRLADFKEN